MVSDAWLTRDHEIGLPPIDAQRRGVYRWFRPVGEAGKPCSRHPSGTCRPQYPARRVSTPQYPSLGAALAERVISAPRAQKGVLPYCSWRLPTAFGETLQELFVSRRHLGRRRLQRNFEPMRRQVETWRAQQRMFTLAAQFYDLCVAIHARYRKQSSGTR